MLLYFQCQGFLFKLEKAVLFFTNVKGHTKTYVKVI